MEVVEIFGNGGRLWKTAPKPAKSQTGAIVNIRNHQADRYVFRHTAFNCTADRVATVDQRGTLYVFHIQANRFALSARAGAAGTALAFSPSRRNLLGVGFADHSTRFYDTDTHQCVATLKGNRTPVVGVVFSPTGRFVVTVSSDRAILWETDTWRKRQTLDAGENSVLDVVFSSASGTTKSGSHSVMVSLFNDNVTTGWDLSNMKEGFTLALPEQVGLPKATFRCQAVSSNSRYLLVAGRARFVCLWELHVQMLVRSFMLPAGAERVEQAAFVPRSDIAGLLCDNGHLYFVNVLTLKVLLEIAPPVRTIRSFALGSSSRYCACILSDGSLMLHDLQVAFRVQAKIRKLRHKGKKTARKPRTDLSVGRKLEAISIMSVRDVGSLVAPKPKPDPKPSLQPKPKAPARPQEPPREERGRLHGKPAEVRPRRAGSRTSAAKMPLHQLAQLDARSRALNRKKLRKLLSTYGEYPRRHRLLIWRFLLQLPENHEAFRALSKKGTHDAFAELHEQYPIQDRRLLRKLELTLSCLAHWSPICGQLSYLPALVFPFVRLFQHDEIVAFEMCVALLINWCRGWFEYFPNPPVGVLQRMERLLEFHDPKLRHHLVHQGIVVQTYMWAVLRTLFTEVLAKDDWLYLFDHVLTHGQSFLEYAVVTFLITIRGSLTAAQGREDFTFLVENPTALPMKQFTRHIYELRRATPKELQLPPHRMQPIAEGASYPPMNSTHYPKFVVDFQEQERRRIQLEVADSEAREKQLRELERRNAELREKQELWAQRQEALRRAEEERRQRWLLEEEVRARQKRRMAHEHAAKRLEQLQLMEKTAEQYMSERDEIKLAELQRLEDEARRKREKEELVLQEQLEKEKIQSLEFEMEQRLLALQAEKERQEAADHLKQIADKRGREKDVEAMVRQAQWQSEDEQARIRSQQARARMERLHRLNSELRSEQELQHVHTMDDMQRAYHLAQVERERRLRQAAEAEVEHTDMLVEEQRQREALLIEEDRLARQKMLDAEKERLAEQARERAELIEQQQKLAQAEAEKRAMRLRDLEREQKRREFEEALRSQRRQYSNQAMQEERELHSVLEKLDKDRAADRRLEMDLLFKEQEVKEKMAFQKVLREAEDRIIEEERARYAKLREELGRRLSREEAAMIKRHEDVMARLIVQRERQLWRMNQQWRDGVREDEMAKMERTYFEHQDRIDDVRRRFDAEENELRRKVRRMGGDDVTHDADGEDYGDYSSESVPISVDLEGDFDALRRRRESDEALDDVEEQHEDDGQSSDRAWMSASGSDTDLLAKYGVHPRSSRLRDLDPPREEDEDEALLREFSTEDIRHSAAVDPSEEEDDDLLARYGLRRHQRDEEDDDGADVDEDSLAEDDPFGLEMTPSETAALTAAAATAASASASAAGPPAGYSVSSSTEFTSRYGYAYTMETTASSD